MTIYCNFLGNPDFIQKLLKFQLVTLLGSFIKFGSTLQSLRIFFSLAPNFSSVEIEIPPIILQLA